MEHIICLALLCGLFAVSSGLHSVNMPVYQICQESLIHVVSEGDEGTLVYSNPRTLLGDQCIVQIRTSSLCAIQVDGAWGANFTTNCQAYDRFDNCYQGCPFVYMFDKFYKNQTQLYYDGPNIAPFQSVSSVMFIGLCHGYTENNNLTLHYRAVRKGGKFIGSADNSTTSVGQIYSPFFPFMYEVNSEMYQFQFRSTRNTDVILLTFDDWSISPDSVFYFSNAGNNLDNTIVTSKFRRPIVQSKANELSVLFNTGLYDNTDTSIRNYIGFKATYKILKEKVSRPNTECKSSGYYLDSLGGVLSFTGSMFLAKFDCLWVVKTQPGYQFTYLKIFKFRTNSHTIYRGDNIIEIRSGLTSDGKLIQSYDILDQIIDGTGHEDMVGFYIRLYADFDNTYELVLTYNSFTRGNGYCAPGQYQCENKRCISDTMVCNGYNHCGDNSDEGHIGCQEGNPVYDKSYQYTITIGVIVPMVISVFLIMIICLLFVMVRRCRRARQQAGTESPAERIPTLSEDVTSGRQGRRRRRRRRNMFGPVEHDMPPTYDEAMQNPPGWYLNVAFTNAVDPTLPQPPSYTEAMESPDGTENPQLPRTESPDSTNSSQSELTVYSHRMTDSSSSSDDDDGETTWAGYAGDSEGRRGRRARHQSSSDSDSDAPPPHVPRGQGRNTRIETTETRSDSVTTAADQFEQSSYPNQTNTADRRVSDKSEPKKVQDKTLAEKLADLLADKDSENTGGDTIVVPDGPKAGSSQPEPQTESHRSNPRPLENQTAGASNSPQGMENSTWSAKRVQDMLQSHSRKSSSASEASKAPPKKPRRSKVVKEHMDETRRPRQDDPRMNREDGRRTVGPHVEDRPPQRLPRPVPAKRNIPPGTRDQAASTNSRERENREPKPRPSNTDASPSYGTVVNVDNDNVVFVYEDNNSRQDSETARYPVTTNPPSRAQSLGSLYHNGRSELSTPSNRYPSSEARDRRSLDLSRAHGFEPLQTRNIPPGHHQMRPSALRSYPEERSDSMDMDSSYQSGNTKPEGQRNLHNEGYSSTDRYAHQGQGRWSYAGRELGGSEQLLHDRRSGSSHELTTTGMPRNSRDVRSSYITLATDEGAEISEDIYV